jgi:aminoglycoside 3-N-acetyltransferase
MDLKETLSGWALKRLDPERFQALRGRYRSARAAVAPLLQRVHGRFDCEDLRQHLEDRVGRDFEVLMVHSSINGMQPMFTQGPVELLKMLMDFCGPERTLAMPAFYFGDPKLGGAAATFRARPRFDLRRTPSQMGLLTELFRRSRGVIQSRHPVYRIAALGPLADELTRGHEHAGSPAGAGPPVDAMTRHDTLLLGIGKRYEVLTQVHHAEDLLGDQFPVPARRGEPLAMMLVDGDEEIPFQLASSSLSWNRNMWKLRRLMPREQLAEWRFHGVPLFATRAADVSNALIAAAARGKTIYDKP